jgi:hypothetical protein
MEKIRIRDKHLGSATLLCRMLQYPCILCRDREHVWAHKSILLPVSSLLRHLLEEETCCHCLRSVHKSILLPVSSLLRHLLEEETCCHCHRSVHKSILLPVSSLLSSVVEPEPEPGP